ncbi:hypothetical protein C6P46_006590 [Rhodotorula mucilaginosa]|uniref:EGF-like domain-containing protein n=1 Tax=Rhodotorula mucilaginosa TaxID=5537 RepID=A0A9P6VWW4_RHOMI|nr:hypothetical protein C6P46_006590 [Rhodotorula mucilaginosa]
MLRESLYLLALLPLLSSPVATAQSPNHSETTANTTNPSAVCTPDRCLVGANSLTAGVHVSTPVNGTTWQIALLPGTYSPATSAFRTDNTSADLSSVFSSQSVPTVPTGFSASGSVDSSSSASYTVALQPGLTTYSSAMYQGSSTRISPPQSASNSTASRSPQKVESLLLTSDTVAIARFANDKSTQMVLWDSLYDVGQLTSGAGSGGLDILQVQSRACTPPCSSGGVCIADGTCAYACSKGFYGRSCSPCPTGCTTCHEGTSGTGMCLDDQASTVISPGSSTASCRCSAGWTTAANGTQCAACASGYYQTSSGECLACDPSCESCSGPNATCLTCRSGLQPDSSDGTRCVTATTASTNGTFVTCPARTFWNSATSACVECNPLCETCFAAGVDGCLSCRSPNVLMPNGGGCVAFDGGTGLCDGAGATNGTTRVANGWVYDNRKNVCDALPPKCAAGGIDSFSSSSTRAGLQCSACLPGSYLVKGACVDTCPDGMMVSTDGKSCQERVVLPRVSSGLRDLLRPRVDFMPFLPAHPASPDLVKLGKCTAPDKTSTSPVGCVVIAGFGVCLEDLVTVAAKSAATDSMEKKKRQLPWWSILLLVLVVLALVALGLWWFRKRDQKRRRARTAKFAKELGDKEVDKKLAALPVSIAYPPIPRADTPSAGSSYASHTRQHHHLIPMSARADSVPLSPNGSSLSGSSSAQEVPLTPRFVLEDPASPISPSPANFPPHPSYQPQHHAATLAAPAAMASQSRWSLSSYGSNATKKRENPKTLCLHKFYARNDGNPFRLADWPGAETALDLFYSTRTDPRARPERGTGSGLLSLGAESRL